MNMQATCFWTFLKQAQKARAAEAIEALDIAIAPKLDLEHYYIPTREGFVRTLIGKDREKKIEQDNHALDWNDPHVQGMIDDVFRDHRMTKYGR